MSNISKTNQVESLDQRETTYRKHLVKLEKLLTGLAVLSIAITTTLDCLAHSTELSQLESSKLNHVAPLVNIVGTPEVEDSMTGRLYKDEKIGNLINSAPSRHATNCTVDFTDSQALAYTEPSLWFDRIYVPWFQECETLKYIDIRPTYYDHLHLSFEDEHVLPCSSNDMAFPSRIENNECQFVDIPTESRTYITTHNSGEHVLVRMYDSNKYIPFNFHQLKIVGSSAVQLCFKKPFSNDNPWIAQSPSSGATSGPWVCWRELTAGYWNVANWAQDVIAVRLSATHGDETFSVDDIEISF